jgi:gliding motility-associated-like protein
MTLTVFKKIRVMYRILLLVPAGILLNQNISAQHIELKNPSLEGNIGRDSIPAHWIAACNTPDVLPGPLNIFKKPNDGKTYAGLHSGPSYREGLAQHLSQSLRKGATYTVSVDLAFSPRYLQPACYANLAIYGGNSPKDTAEKLWSSGSFTDTTWRRFNAELNPSDNYQYISVWADPVDDCAASTFGTAVLIDNFSSIREVIATRISATSSCNNINTGTVSVAVTNGSLHTPYTYLWLPGKYTTAKVENLAPGNYTVVVTAPSGVTGGGTVTVPASDLHAGLVTTPASCAGEQNGEISVAVTGGISPYTFALDNGDAVKDPVFTGLDIGRHQVIIRDGQLCTDTLTTVLKAPAPLSIKNVVVKPCSCSETTDGKIALKLDGGTAPYRYRIAGGEWQQDSILHSLKAGFYQYEVADTNGCAMAGSASITSPFEHCLVMMPTAFSPNGDGKNDVFKPRIYDAVKQYSMTIFNRWGAIVFQTQDPQSGWDGTYKGMVQDQQAFIYVCTFHDRNDELKEFRGSVVLVR